MIRPPNGVIMIIGKCQNKECDQKAVVKLKLYESDESKTEVIVCYSHSKELSAIYPDNIEILEENFEC